MKFGDIVYSENKKKGIFIGYYDGGGEPYYGMNGHDKLVVWEGTTVIDKVYRSTDIFTSIEGLNKHLEEKKIKEIERLEKRLKELKNDTKVSD